jgi:glucans biosynthesis protein C
VLLNRPFRWLPWANASVFPWYVLHQSLIVLIAWWLLPLHLGAVSESLLVLGGTVLGCWAITTLVARVPWLRPCLGMKVRTSRALPAASKSIGSLASDCQ